MSACRQGPGLAPRGGTFPHAGAVSALPHKPMGQVVLAMAMWGPWAGPTRGGELCVPAYTRWGGSPPSGSVFVMIWMVALL